MTRSTRLRAGLLILLVAGSFIAFKFLPVGNALGLFLERVAGLGIWGPVILGGVYVVATVAMVPGSILTLGAGFVFGVVVGTATVSVASVSGATAAFLVARYFARGWVTGLAARYPKFRAVDRAVRENGFKIVLLTRLSPVFPFSLLNYMYGLTQVRLRDFVLASWIGMFPGTLMYVYFGSLFKNIAELLGGNVEGGTARQVLLVVGLIVTVVVTIYVTRIARRAIRTYVDDGEAARSTAVQEG